MKIINGNIFNSGCEFITNPVNTVGISGKGLAKQFKELYPTMQNFYVELCKNNKLNVEEPKLFIENNTKIILFPTKKHWKNPSQLQWIKNGLSYLIERVNAKEYEISSIAFPLLGCGLGNLSEEEVLPLLESFEINSGISCEIYKL